jgi:release factor glutamine methyltransferase
MNISEVFDRGSVTFMGQSLLVAKGALIPRAETELLGHTAVEIVQKMGIASPRLIDMCCGAGNLACGIASQLTTAQIWASDLTTECVELARRNVQHVGVADRVQVFQGDLFASLEGSVPKGEVDVIVCNPPYISEQKLATDRAALLEHEPREAFDAGPYGLKIHQRVVKEALAYLRSGGVLMFEFGAGQEKQISILFTRTKAYGDVRLVNDTDGVPRVALAAKL